jgi:nucleoside-diphosphate-sugar epimerase
MTHVLVTGGAGFIGTTLCRTLRDAGSRVTAVDRMPSARQRANAALLDGVNLVVADLHDLDLRRLLDGVDAVVHLAGQPGVQTSWAGGFDSHLRANVGLAQRVLEAALDVGVARVVVASSSSVYGEAAACGPVDETVRPAPVSPYGATKAAMDLLVGAYAARGVPAVSLRYFTVYGRLQRPDMAIHRLLAAGLGGPPFPLRGDGRQVRDLTHIDDIVAGTVAAITAPLPAGAVVNLGSGMPVPLREVIACCAQVLGRPVPVTSVAAAPGDPARTWADIGRARRLLDWQPRVALAEGVADQADWQRHPDRAADMPLVS